MEKELLLEGKENTISINTRIFNPEGEKLSIILEGQISGKVEGITYLRMILMKPDRNGDVEIKSIIFIFVWICFRHVYLREKESACFSIFGLSLLLPCAVIVFLLVFIVG